MSELLQIACCCSPFGTLFGLGGPAFRLEQLAGDYVITLVPQTSAHPEEFGPNLVTPLTNPTAAGHDGGYGDMIVFEGELYACGRLDNNPSASAVSKWQGTHWQSVGTLGQPDRPLSSARCFAVHNSQLYCGGYKSGSGPCLYRLDSDWVPLFLDPAVVAGGGQGIDAMSGDSSSGGLLLGGVLRPQVWNGADPRVWACIHHGDGSTTTASHVSNWPAPPFDAFSNRPKAFQTFGGQTYAVGYVYGGISGGHDPALAPGCFLHYTAGEWTIMANADQVPGRAYGLQAHVDGLYITCGGHNALGGDLAHFNTKLLRYNGSGIEHIQSPFGLGVRMESMNGVLYIGLGGSGGHVISFSGESFQQLVPPGGTTVRALRAYNEPPLVV